MRNLAYIILPMAFISMIVGVTGGYARMGIDFPLLASSSVAQHGVLMVGCFLGTLISVERIVASHKNWVWLVPTFMALSFPLLLLDFTRAAYLSLIIGSIGYFVIIFNIWKEHKHKGFALMLLGALFQIIANITLILTNSYPTALAGWLLFILLTIVGERLDLTRFLPVKKQAFKALNGLLFITFLGILVFHFGFPWVLGLGATGLATWLFLNDIALINIQKKGSYKFLGSALLCSYFWLFIFGVLAILNVKNPYQYDAFVHTFFIGFVLNMIIAHAPIILPGVLGINIKPFHPTFYIWLFLFQISLAMRIGGDLSQSIELRKFGGFFNGVSFLFYLANVAFVLYYSKLTFKYAKNN